MEIIEMLTKFGNESKDQVIIKKDNKRYCRSYDTIIAVQDISTGQVILDKDSWDYSRTTGEYRNQFLGEDIAKTRKKIAGGEYLLQNLN